MSHHDALIHLKIDGREVQVAAGATILEAAAAIGIKIPTLCWLQKVSPTGACRICVVEVAGADKTMTACNTRAVDGMEVTTQSEKLSAIRRQVVELLLVNHPLDCPVCDAGGECDLQDICYSQNVTRQPFAAEDVNAPTIDHWPLIQQVPNRCILCEKCVKVCYEVVGADALLVNEKGDKAFIDKDLAKCEFCGNCVQVCPTGTMISKPFKFKARPWELRKTPSFCTLCPAQCQVNFESKQGKVLRVTAQDGCAVNDGNLCVGGFFGHGYLNSDLRLTVPLVAGQPAGWDEALGRVTSELARLRDAAGSQALAGIAGGHLTGEEGLLFEKLFREALGSGNLDSAARFDLLRAVKVLRSQLGQAIDSQSLTAVGSAEAILVFGCDPTSEAPAVDWQIQLAHRKRDAKLVVADPRRVKLAGQAEVFLPYRPGSEVWLAGALAKLIVAKGYADGSWLGQKVGNREQLLAYLDGIDVAAACAASGVDQKLLEEAATHLGAAGSVAVVFGRAAMGAADAEGIVAALANLALVSGALQGTAGGLFPVAVQGNAMGLLAAGVCPEFLPGFQENPAGGADAGSILAGIEKGEVKALYLAGCNPLVEFPESGRWQAALAKLELLVVQDILASELTAMAHVVLPGAATAEKGGTVTALDGRVNALGKAVDAPGEARPDLAIFGALFTALSGKPVPSAAALRDQLGSARPAAGALQGAAPALTSPATAEMQLLIGKCPFHFGTLTTCSPANLELAAGGVILINPADAARLGVADGGQLKVTGPAGTVSGRALVKDKVPPGLLSAADSFAELKIQQIMPSGSNCVAVTAAKG